MSDLLFAFPADFRWGVAVASHQVEGDNRGNQWWAWEQVDGHIAEGHRSGLACNWWANPEPDLDLAAQMGVNALRLSLEWSRIEPQPDRWDDRALARYQALLRAVRARGMEPMVTLHHFTDPLWLAERGGWENPDTPERFARYVRKVVEALSEECHIWCTVNEPNVYAFMGYLQGTFPPGKQDLRAAGVVLRHLLEGHAAAYREIHALQPLARVGFAHNVRLFDPACPLSPLDRLMAWLFDLAFNRSSLEPLVHGRLLFPAGRGRAPHLHHTLDWIGLNYYTRDRIVFALRRQEMLFARRLRRPDIPFLDGDYGEYYPAGMYRCLRRLARLGLPIYVTENGCPDADDDLRPRYLLTHLCEVWRGIQAGWPVHGYYHWTLVDNFEWAAGWTLRFGLIELDWRNQTRRPRPSAQVYATVIRNRGISRGLAEQHAPELLAALRGKPSERPLGRSEAPRGNR
ncbi:MAG: glycoside hydrolase family 1 protein [Chloroflexia bacterium]